MADLIDTNSASAKASDILESKTAYVKSGLVAGTIPMQAGSTVVPGAASKTVVDRGKYITSNIVMAGDENLKPENIAKNVTMFGVKGTWEGDPPPPGLPKGFYEITVDSSEPDVGTVSGGGVASLGMDVSVQAESIKENFSFDVWKENNEIVSLDSTYRFKVEQDRKVTAHFSKPILEWAKGNDTPSGMYLFNCAAYGNGYFVAAGYPSKGVYSTDGTTWSSMPFPSSISTSIYWESIAYGNGSFVAVGCGSSTKTSTYLYSTSGKSWSSSTLPSSLYWNIVVYGNGRFVVFARESNTVAYSNNNSYLTWKTSNLPSAPSYKIVCATYGNDKFVAIDNNGFVYYSTDGIEWKKTEIPILNYSKWNGIAYGGGKFVAVSETAGFSAYSLDGVTWGKASIPLQYPKLYNVVFGDGIFVSVNSNISNRDMDYSVYSEDGARWKYSPFSFQMADIPVVAYGNGKFVVLDTGTSLRTAYGVISR